MNEKHESRFFLTENRLFNYFHLYQVISAGGYANYQLRLTLLQVEHMIKGLSVSLSGFGL
jgi:hypothetical protein